MRILQVCSARTLGGGERHVADLANALVKRGHDLFAAIIPNSPLIAELTEVPRQNIVRLSLRNSIDLGSAVRLARFARDNRIELIHAHLAKDYVVVAAASRIAGIPYIITRHVLFPMSRAHRRLLSRVSFVIALSNAIAGSLRTAGIFPAEKIITIRYGINVDRFPETSLIPHRGFRVVSIGNLDPVKGFDILIRAAAIVAAQRPDVEFEIIGEDRSRSRRNERELRRLISEMEPSTKVVLSGWSDKIPEKLPNFDVFVSTSRTESFGAAIAEAMLCGVPVIATETEGAKEIISDPSLGRLVPVDSPRSLAAEIIELIDNEQTRAQLALNGRAHILANFSFDRMVDETERLYRRIVPPDR